MADYAEYDAYAAPWATNRYDWSLPREVELFVQALGRLPVRADDPDFLQIGRASRDLIENLGDAFSAGGTPENALTLAASVGELTETVCATITRLHDSAATDADGNLRVETWVVEDRLPALRQATTDLIAWMQAVGAARLRSGADDRMDEDTAGSQGHVVEGSSSGTRWAADSLGIDSPDPRWMNAYRALKEVAALHPDLPLAPTVEELGHDISAVQARLDHLMMLADHTPDRVAEQAAVTHAALSDLTSRLGGLRAFVESARWTVPPSQTRPYDDTLEAIHEGTAAARDAMTQVASLQEATSTTGDFTVPTSTWSVERVGEVWAAAERALQSYLSARAAIGYDGSLPEPDFAVLEQSAAALGECMGELSTMPDPAHTHLSRVPVPLRNQILGHLEAIDAALPDRLHGDGTEHGETGLPMTATDDLLGQVADSRARIWASFDEIATLIAPGRPRGWSTNSHLSWKKPRKPLSLGLAPFIETANLVHEAAISMPYPNLSGAAEALGKAARRASEIRLVTTAVDDPDIPIDDTWLDHLERGSDTLERLSTDLSFHEESHQDAFRTSCEAIRELEALVLTCHRVWDALTRARPDDPDATLLVHFNEFITYAQHSVDDIAVCYDGFYETTDAQGWASGPYLYGEKRTTLEEMRQLYLGSGLDRLLR